MADVRRALQDGAEGVGYSGTWAAVVERILRQAQPLQAVFSESRTRHGARVDEAVRLLREEVRATLEGATNLVAVRHVRELLRLIDDHEQIISEWGQPPDRDAILMRAVSQGIDDAVGPGFLDAFKNRIWLELRPGTVFPVTHYDPRPILGTGHLTTPPDRLPAIDLGVVKHLRLADERFATYRVVLDWDASNSLAGLDAPPPMKIATWHPNRALDEFESVDVPATQEGSSSEIVPPLSPVQPQDARIQVSRLARAVDETARVGARIAVLPEYSLGEADREAVRRLLSDVEPPPVLTVGGSSVVSTADGRAVNQAVLWMADREYPLTKVHPAVVAGQTEDIDPGSELRVFCAPNWALSVLVCMDAYSTDVIRLLEDVGVNLVIVVAMTDATASLLGNVSSVPARTQGICLLANAPLRWGDAADPDRAVSALLTPHRAVGPAIVTEMDVREPSIVSWDTSDRSWSSMPL